MDEKMTTEEISNYFNKIITEINNIKDNVQNHITEFEAEINDPLDIIFKCDILMNLSVDIINDVNDKKEED